VDLAHTVARIERMTLVPHITQQGGPDGKTSLSYEETHQASGADHSACEPDTICSGCGLYSCGHAFGHEHACHRNADGTYEAGGQFM
jgi:hypothetical protein